MISLSHLGIAVSDLPKVRQLFALLGLHTGHVEEVPEQGVKAHFIDLPPLSGASQNSRIELLEAVDPEGTVAKFIQKRGPGVHHLAFQVEKGKLGPLCEKLRAAGVRLTYDQPRQGAHGMQINFIHPASAGGLLIELMESGD